MKKSWLMNMLMMVIIAFVCMTTFAQEGDASAGAGVVAGDTVSVGDWITQNLSAVFAIVTATLGVVAMICKLTPSPKDDAIVAKILGWLKLIPVKKSG